MAVKARNLPKNCIPICEEAPVGITEYRTAIDFWVCQVHYSADPIKRKPEWKARHRKGFTDRDWRRELEIDWSIAGGTPVFPEYDKARHESTEILKPLIYLPVIVGIDPGMNPAAVFLQIQRYGEADHQQQVRVLRTLTAENKAMNLFGPEIVVVLRELEAEAGQSLTAEYFGDPFGDAKTSAEGKTPYQVLRTKCGIIAKKGIQRWGVRRVVVSERLVVDAAKGVPSLLISNHPSNQILKDGFGGAYAYPESAATTAEMPQKNKYSHPQDALQYPLTKKFPLMNEKARGEAVTADGEGVSGEGEGDAQQAESGEKPLAKKDFNVSRRASSTPTLGGTSRSRPSQARTPFGTRHSPHQRMTATQDGNWNPALQSSLDDAL